jgi:hypothetical protein
VNFEILLNALWVCLAAVTLGVTLGIEYCSRRNCATRIRASRIAAALFAIIFLFPCISESDDLLTLQNLQFTFETRGEMGNPLPGNPSDAKPGIYLARFFQDLQSFRVTAFCIFVPTLLFTALVIPAAAVIPGWALPATPGRAPPAPTFA